MRRLHGLAVDQEEEAFMNGVKEDILRAAKVVGGACSEEEIDKTIEELKEQLMEYVGMAAREEGGEAWYSDRMRTLGLQVTELKKRKESMRKESIQKQEKKLVWQYGPAGRRWLLRLSVPDDKMKEQRQDISKP